MRKKVCLSVLLVLFIAISSINSISAYDWEKDYDFQEMNGTIVDKDVSGIAIDYLIRINGTDYYLSSFYQPYEEFFINDNVTMNGTIMDSNGSSNHMGAYDFDGKYKDEYLPWIKINKIPVENKDYGQMRLTNDTNNEYYYNVYTF